MEDDGGADVHYVASREPHARANGNVSYYNRSYGIVCPHLSNGERPLLLEAEKHCNEISPEPFLLQSEQLQLSQTFLIGEVLHVSRLPPFSYSSSSLEIQALSQGASKVP